jgi:hypothetical protein
MPDTRLLSASHPFEGKTAIEAAQSIQAALLQLDLLAAREGRTALFDTLSIEVEKGWIEERTFVSTVRTQTWTNVAVTVEAVKGRVSETEE